MARKKKKVSGKGGAISNPWFQKASGDDDWSWIPLNWKGFVTFVLLLAVNVFAAQYLGINKLTLEGWISFGVVFFLSLFIFVMIAKRKTEGVRNDI